MIEGAQNLKKKKREINKNGRELKQKHQMAMYMVKMIVYTYCLIICDNESGIPQGN